MFNCIGAICIYFGISTIAGSFIIYIMNSINIALGDGQLFYLHPFTIFIIGGVFLLIGVLFFVPDWLIEKKQVRERNRGK